VQNQFDSAQVIRIMPLGEKDYTHDLYRLNIICISNKLNFFFKLIIWIRQYHFVSWQQIFKGNKIEQDVPDPIYHLADPSGRAV